jgi:uncharacterized protein YbaR (Trm112 family)
MTLDRELMEIVRCPACLGTFADPAKQGDPHELECTQCGNAYPVRNGVPVLLVDEARRPADG